MRTFKDGAGRNWDLRITVDDMRRVRQALDITLSDVREGNPPLLLRLDLDLTLLGAVVFELVRKQAENLGVSQEQFESSLDGDATARMAEAFWGELSDFFRPFKPLHAELIEDLRAPPGRSSTNSPGSSG